MSKILILAEHDQTRLRGVTRNAVGAARQLGDDIHVLVAGQGARSVAEAAASLEGVTKVLLAEGEAHARPLAENLAPLLARLGADYEYVLAAASSFGKNVLPRAAALLDVGMVSEVLRIEAPDTFVRPMYAGNVLATVQSSDTIKVLSIRATAFAAVGEGGSAEIESVAPAEDSGLSRWLSTELTPSDRPELGSARVVVSGGRALGSAENFDRLMLPLAERLNAAVGASRAAVDTGYAPNDWQVGQTGTVVAPELYIAVGISGAVQHLAGMKDSGVIVAINSDPDAAIFKVSDYALVGDLFELVPQLTERL